MKNHNIAQKFITKPSAVEAFRLTEDEALRYFIGKESLPFGIALSGSYHIVNKTVSRADALVESKNGKQQRASLGDWIVRHENGDLSVETDKSFWEKYQGKRELYKINKT